MPFNFNSFVGGVTGIGRKPSIPGGGNEHQRGLNFAKKWGVDESRFKYPDAPSNPFGGFQNNNPFFMSDEEFRNQFGGDITPEEQRIIDARRIAAGQYRGILDRQAGEFDLERSAFSRRLRGVVGQQQAVARTGAEQEAGRRGLAFSGVEQAALANVSAQGATAIAQSTAEFEGQLARLQQQERAMFTAGAYDFIRNIHLMNVNEDIETELRRFQAELQADLQANDLWGQIMGTAAQLGTMWFTGGFVNPATAVPSGRPPFN